jgi:hypothetical protein
VEDVLVTWAEDWMLLWLTLLGWDRYKSALAFPSTQHVWEVGWA